MEQHDVVFQKSLRDWALSIFMLLLPLPLFWFFYPWSGFDNGNKVLIYPLFIVLSLFFYGFYRTFLMPHSLLFQDGILVIKSLLFPKVVVIAEIQSVLITEKEGGKGSAQALCTLVLKNGDPIELSLLTKIDNFTEKLTTQNSEIEIKDERIRKNAV